MASSVVVAVAGTGSLTYGAIVASTDLAAKPTFQNAFIVFSLNAPVALPVFVAQYTGN